MKDNLGDYAAIAFLFAYMGACIVAIAMHVYGCWLIGGFVGVAAFFFPPIPIIVAIAHSLGVI